MHKLGLTFWVIVICFFGCGEDNQQEKEKKKPTPTQQSNAAEATVSAASPENQTGTLSADIAIATESKDDETGTGSETGDNGNSSEKKRIGQIKTLLQQLGMEEAELDQIMGMLEERDGITVSGGNNSIDNLAEIFGSNNGFPDFSGSSGIGGLENLLKSFELKLRACGKDFSSSDTKNAQIPECFKSLQEDFLAAMPTLDDDKD